MEGDLWEYSCGWGCVVVFLGEADGGGEEKRTEIDIGKPWYYRWFYINFSVELFITTSLQLNGEKYRNLLF